MLAAAFDASELSLDLPEAKALAEAGANLASFYPINVDPKAWAWVQLGVCAAGIYGPKAYAMARRKADEARAAKPAPVPLHTLRPAG